MTASPPSSPSPFLDYTFIMGDHTTRARAHELAEALSLRDNTLYVDDFLGPIHDGYAAMFNADWRKDFADPKQRAGIELGAKNDATVDDLLVSLEKWFTEQFGEHALGQLALQRSRTNRAGFDYPYLFRDATHAHILPFLKTTIPARNMMFVWLTLSPALLEMPAAVLHIHTMANESTDAFVERILKELAK